jgi:hypothetical protein
MHSWPWNGLVAATPHWTLYRRRKTDKSQKSKVKTTLRIKQLTRGK